MRFALLWRGVLNLRTARIEEERGCGKFARIGGADSRGVGNHEIGLRLYFSITPHATRSPELPDGSDMRSSALA